MLQYGARGGGKSAILSGLLDLEAEVGDLGLAEISNNSVSDQSQDNERSQAAVSSHDLGFRVLKIDSSNRRPSLTVDQYQQDLLSQLDSRFKEGRTDLDIFFGCLLDYRLPLDLAVTTVNLAGHMAYVYGQGALLACFAEDIDASFVEAISNLPEEQRPLRVVLNERCFSSSEQQINLSERFKTLLPQVELKVL